MRYGVCFAVSVPMWESKTRRWNLSKVNLEIEKLYVGCDYVVHCAAKTGQSGSYDSYEQVNVTATERLVELAFECGVKRVVNVASANVFAYGTKGQPGDETRSMAAPFTESAYARSKFEALQRLEHFRNQVEIVTVCPTFMIGAWDS